MNDALTLQLLTWIGEGSRPYAETIEAWRTSCPRLTVWEDAFDDGLLERVPGPTLGDARVRLTRFGLSRLATRDMAPA